MELGSTQQTHPRAVEVEEQSSRTNDYLTRESARLQSKPINDTWLCRAFTLLAIQVFKRWCSRRSNVLFLPRNLCIKYSTFQNVSEAATMQYIAAHTKIPVPKVYCAFKHQGWTYIVMEKVDGEMLGYRWSHRTNESKAKIFSQLKKMVAEMRSIPPLKIWESRMLMVGRYLMVDYRVSHRV